jgi:hypothetical protein
MISSVPTRLHSAGIVRVTDTQTRGQRIRTVCGTIQDPANTTATTATSSLSHNQAKRKLVRKCAVIDDESLVARKPAQKVSKPCISFDIYPI